MVIQHKQTKLDHRTVRHARCFENGRAYNSSRIPLLRQFLGVRRPGPPDLTDMFGVVGYESDPYDLQLPEVEITTEKFEVV